MCGDDGGGRRGGGGGGDEIETDPRTAAGDVTVIGVVRYHWLVRSVVMSLLKVQLGII